MATAQTNPDPIPGKFTFIDPNKPKPKVNPNTTAGFNAVGVDAQGNPINPFQYGLAGIINQPRKEGGIAQFASSFIRPPSFTPLENVDIKNIGTAKLAEEKAIEKGATDEFELMRKRLLSRGAATSEGQQRQLNRQFASLGNLPSGAAFKIRQEALEAGERQLSEDLQSVNLVEAQTLRAERESRAARQLERDLATFAEQGVNERFVSTLNNNIDMFNAEMHFREAGFSLQQAMAEFSFDVGEQGALIDNFATFINSLPVLQEAGWTSEDIKALFVTSPITLPKEMEEAMFGDPDDPNNNGFLPANPNDPPDPDPNEGEPGGHQETAEGRIARQIREMGGKASQAWKDVWDWTNSVLSDPGKPVKDAIDATSTLILDDLQDTLEIMSNAGFSEADNLMGSLEDLSEGAKKVFKKVFG